MMGGELWNDLLRMSNLDTIVAKAITCTLQKLLVVRRKWSHQYPFQRSTQVPQRSLFRLISNRQGSGVRKPMKELKENKCFVRRQFDGQDSLWQGGHRVWSSV
jgi:hypothetical protein